MYTHLQVLRYFRSGALLPIEIQEQMRALKNELSMMDSRVSNCRNTLHNLSEDEEEMCLMNLSCLKKKPKLYAFPLVDEIRGTHDQIEVSFYVILCTSIIYF